MLFCDRCLEKIEDNFVRATTGSETFLFCSMDCFQDFATLNDVDECTLEFVIKDDE